MAAIQARRVGYAVVGVAILLFVLSVFSAQQTIAINMELHKSCPLPAEVCPYKRGELPVESMLMFLGDGAIALLGFYMISSSHQFEKAKLEESAQLAGALEKLRDIEKQIYGHIKEAGGFVFQGELVEKSGVSKVKVTRILDKLEGLGLVERRRRGMSNVVVLKYAA